MIAAPHTSNRDFIYMIAALDICGLDVRYTIKKELIDTPLKYILLPLGAIPIDRSPKKPGEKRPSLVEAMANLFDEHEKLIVAVTPEGTRSLRTQWKTGFYHVAKIAKVPIALGYLDFKNKKAGVGGIIEPSGDMDADMRKITAFYKEKTAMYPEKYSVDERYL